VISIKVRLGELRSTAAKYYGRYVRRIRPTVVSLLSIISVRYDLHNLDLVRKTSHRVPYVRVIFIIYLLNVYIYRTRVRITVFFSSCRLSF